MGAEISEFTHDLDDHLVAYVDLLGFRNAVRSNENKKKIFELLRELAQFKGDFVINSTETENGHQSFVRPAVTVFSDNIVISYPMTALKEHKIELDLAIEFLTNLIGYVAWNALALGLLIRGGIAIGELFHENGVVVGRGLIDAYEIESTVAIYPRVVVSQQVAQDEGARKFSSFFVDSDGLFCLPLMMKIIMRTEAQGGKFNVDVKPWVAELRRLISEQIARFDAKGDLRHLAKWKTFERHLELGISATNPALLESTSAG